MFLMGLLAYLGYDLDQQRKANGRPVVISHRAILESERLHSMLKNAQQAHITFFLTGDQAHLTHYYKRAQAKWWQSQQRLRSLTTEFAPQHRQLSILHAHIRKILASWAQARKEIRMHEKFSGPQALRMAQKEKMTDSVGPRIVSFQQEALAQHQPLQWNSQRQSVYTQLASGFIVLFLLGLFFAFLKKKMSRKEELSRALELKVQERTLALQQANEKLLSSEEEIKRNREQMAGSLERLQESENRFRTIATFSPTMIWMTCREGTPSYFNEPWLRFRGISLSEALGGDWLDGIHPDDVQRCRDTYQSALAQRLPFELDYRWMRYDGQYRWVFNRGIPHLSDEEFYGYIGSLLDISERKAAEGHMQELKQRMEGIIQSAMDAIISIDGSGRIVVFNQSAEQMFGYSAREVLGSSVDRLIPERFRARHHGHVTAYASAGNTARMKHADMPLFGLRKSGEEFSMEASISRSETQDGKIFTVIIRDITERVKVQERLETKKQRFELALLGGNLGMWDWDLETGMVVLSQRDAEMLGSDSSEVRAGASDWMHWIHPSDQSVIKALLEAHFQGQSPYFQAEYRLKTLHGEWVWVMGSGKVLAHHANGAPTRMLGTHLDISQRKETEKKLRFQAQLLELIDTGVISLAEDFRIRTWSRGAESLFGLGSQEVTGRLLSEILVIRPYDESGSRALFERLREQTTWKGEVTMEANLKEAMPIFLTVSRFADAEGEEGYILVCKDIQEISAIQHQLIQHQSYVLAAIENSTLR